MVSYDQPRDSGTPCSLPFPKLVPFAFGALLGILIRLTFSGRMLDDFALPGVMTFSFLLGMPAAVGAVTVIVAERIERKSWSYYVLAPWASVLLVAGGTALTLLEGSICIVLATPIFFILGSIGGLAAGIASRLLSRPTQGLPVFASLPFALAGIESGIPVVDRLGQVESSIEIAAPAATVWELINDVTGIAPSEIDAAWIHRIGVPRPLAGVTSVAASGRVRVSQWEKGVRFREIITDWEPARYLRWTYQFDADSFPPGALDDHVVIGGRYFDLLSTSYELQPTAAGTRMTIRTEYRVTTGFNWYADGIAQLVLRDFMDAIGTMYQARAQADATHASPAQAMATASGRSRDVSF